MDSSSAKSVDSRRAVFVAGRLEAHSSVVSATKRAIDILGSCVGLGLLALVCIPLAIAIKLDSPGRVLFAQVRVGLKGKPFRLYKFRTMVSNAEQLKRQIRNEASGPIFKSRRDPRITKVGHFLRKTSLDELPQFWNVLWGDMSLVGTRPPTVEEVKHYNERHWRRLNVKPGLTGEWQVYGRSNVTNFEEVVDLDLRYQSRWSIRYDLVLILRTILVMVRGDGAY